MANEKISQLAPGAPAQLTDLIPIARGAQNFSLKLSDVIALIASSQVATPTFSPAAGTYTTIQSVTISCSTPSSTIYYTTDGSTPTTGSTVYTTPVTVTVSETLKAIATATGLIQSAVGSAAYTINLTLNPMFLNLSAGAQAVFEFEEQPTFTDLVTNSRGFTIGSSYTYASATAQGWPDGSQATINIVLFTGANGAALWNSGTAYVIGNVVTLGNPSVAYQCILGNTNQTPPNATYWVAQPSYFLQPWFYNFAGNTYRAFNGKVVGNGAETITGNSGCTITNIVRSGATTTFNLTLDGSGNPVILIIGGVTVSFTLNVFLPDYPTGVSAYPAGPGGTAPYFTNDTINTHSQFGGTRFMDWSYAWFNTAHNTAATMNTPANTVTNKGWSAPGIHTEGYPIQWAINHCLACYAKNPRSGGCWICLPMDAANDYITAVANDLFTSMPVGVPIIIEIANENWNGTGLAYNILHNLSNAAGSAYQDAQFTGTITGNSLAVSGVTGTIGVNDFVYYAGVPSASVVINSGSGPYTLNTSPGNVGPIAMTTTNINNGYAYLAVLLHNVASIFKTVFGARYGTDLNIVLGTLGNGTALANQCIQNSITQGYMPATGWASAATADYHYMGVAPYLNLYGAAGNGAPAWNSGTAYVIGNVISSGGAAYLCILGNTNNVPPNATYWVAQANWTVAQIEANLAGTDGSGNPCASNITCNSRYGMERLSVLSKSYGMKGLITYEGDWQVNQETPSTTNANIGNTLADSGLIPVLQTLHQKSFDSGATLYCRFKGGVAGVKTVPSAAMLFDQFDSSCTNLNAGTSPNLLGCTPFFNGATPAKNAINGSGSSWSALSYADNLGSVYPTLALGTVSSGLPSDIVIYNVNVNKAGTYSLRAFFTNSGAAANCDVAIDGHVIITGTANIPATITNQQVILGNITVGAGPHSLYFGRAGTAQGSVTLGALANAGADITVI